MSMDSAHLDNWASCFGLPATPHGKQSKPEKVSDETFTPSAGLCCAVYGGAAKQ